MAYDIRRAAIGDTDAVYQLICDLAEKTFDRELFGRYYADNLASDKNIYLVATSDSDIVGVISCHGQLLLHHMGWVYEIQEMIVRSDHRSKGIGGLLIDALEAELAAIDYDILEVTSSTRRTATHRFYISNGFPQTHYKFTKKPAPK